MAIAHKSDFEIEKTKEATTLSGKPGFWRSRWRKYEKILDLASPAPRKSTERHDEGQMNRFVLGAALIASVSSMLLGYDVGVTSGALLFIQDDFKLTDFQKEVFVSSLSLVSLVGALLSGRMSDAFGRRVTIASASAIFLLGSTLMALSPSYSLLMIGRLVTGIGVGFGFTAAPLYTAELAPPRSRGLLVSLSEVFINSGILVGYIASYALKNLPEGVNWRCMLGLGGVPAFLLGLGVFLLPESPRWLVMKGRLDEARAVLDRTSSGEGEAEARLREIVEASGGSTVGSARLQGEWADRAGSSFGVQDSLPGMQREKGREEGGEEQETGLLSGSEGGKGVWKELLNPTDPVKRMLWVCLGTNIFQQATGIDAAVYYSPVIFKQAGISGRSALLAATVGMGVVKTVFILLAMTLLDNFGRRPLLLVSTAGMTLALLTESLGFLLLRQKGEMGESALTSADPPPADGPLAPALIIAASCFFVASFSVGLGPINWVLTSEIFPLRLRAQAFALGTAVNRLASGIVALSFLSLGDSLSPAGCFFLFSCVGLASVGFFYRYAPETKGKSLEEIEKMFQGKGEEKGYAVVEEE